MSLRTLAVVAGLLLGVGCSSKNEDHCFYNGGDAACQARGSELPYCSKCVGENDGCVAQPVESECSPGTTTATTQTTEPGTTSPTSTGAVTTGSSGMTGSGTTSSGTSGSTGTGTTTGATTGQTTTGTTTTDGSTSDMSSGTDSSGGSSGGSPTCGDGVKEGMEACDKNDFGGKDCTDFGFGGGMLKCAGNCTVDTAMCCKIQGKSCLMNSECCSNMCVLTCQ